MAGPVNAPRIVTIGEKNPAEFLVQVMKGLNLTHFTATGPVPLVKVLAAEAQRQLGYHPEGYSGPDHISTETLAGGTVVTRWDCRASCD